MKKDEILHEELKGLKELFLEKFDANDKIHNLILEQTTAHNGRMRSLEKWRSYITGGLAVLCALVLPILIMIVRIKIE